MTMRRICVIGCGTGQATVLKALAHLAHRKRRRLDVTAVVGVTDNGGHSGVLRRELGIPAVGDTRACLTAVSCDPFLTALLEYRFTQGRQKGICVGNLLLAAEAVRRGSLVAAADAFCSAVRASTGFSRRTASRTCAGPNPPSCRSANPIYSTTLKKGGQWGIWGCVLPDDFCDVSVVPVSDGVADICAELEDGGIVCGEWQIIRRKPRSPIRRLFHEPLLEAHPRAVRAVRRAQVIIIAPGSLRTGIVSVLLARGIREAISASRATIVYVSNIMTQPGQTDGFSFADHIAELAKYAGQIPTDVIANTSEPSRRLLRSYRATGAEIVEPQGGWSISGDRVAAEKPAGRKASEAGRIRAIVESRERPDAAGLVRRHEADLVHQPTRRELARFGRARSASMHAGPHFIRHDPMKLARALEQVEGIR